MPLKAVLVADRYLLVATLGFTLCVAWLVLSITSSRARAALIAVLCIAAGARTLDAQSNWRDTVTLWKRATVSNPQDGDAWSSYAEALIEAGQPEHAIDAVAAGLRATMSPRLVLREALLVLEHGQRPQGMALMRRAAELGEVRAMSNLAVLLAAEGHVDEARTWAQRATTISPVYAKGFRVLGSLEAQTQHFDAAVEAYRRALALTPVDLALRLDLANVLIELHRYEEARPHLVACLLDPTLGRSALESFARLP